VESRVSRQERVCQDLTRHVTLTSPATGPSYIHRRRPRDGVDTPHNETLQDAVADRSTTFGKLWWRASCEEAARYWRPRALSRS